LHFFGSSIAVDSARVCCREAAKNASAPKSSHASKPASALAKEKKAMPPIEMDRTRLTKPPRKSDDGSTALPEPPTRTHRVDASRERRSATRGRARPMIFTQFIAQKITKVQYE
jgi:hypothetical protein